MSENNSSGTLYPCPECENMVSIYADRCPKCGCPLKAEKRPEPKRQGTSGGGVFLAVVFGIIVAVLILSQILKVEIVGTITPLK